MFFLYKLLKIICILFLTIGVYNVQCLGNVFEDIKNIKTILIGPEVPEH